MSRDDGFPIADLDTGLLHDPKIVALARRIRNEHQTATHVALYLALVLESWSTGHRVTLDEALPAWWMEPPEEIRVALRDVGLIDEESRIPERSWRSWFVPAWQRRQDRIREGRISGLVSHGMARDEAVKEAARRESEALVEVTSGLPQGLLDPSARPADRPSRQAGPAVSSVSTSAGADGFEATAPRCEGCGSDDIHETMELYTDGRIRTVCSGKVA